MIFVYLHAQHMPIFSTAVNELLQSISVFVLTVRVS